MGMKYFLLNVDSLEFTAPDKAYFMQNMNIRATKQNGENQLRLTSEFLKASIEGKFLNTSHYYL